MKSLSLSGFTELKALGHGTYGSVFKARRESDGNVYAVKVVNLTQLNPKEIEDSLNEIRIMASFTSPFIIRFYEAFIDNKRLCIVSEYSRLGDLAHLIERRKRKNKPLLEETIWCYFLQLLEGLNTLHSSGVIHRDLKSANILLSAPDLIKIADLGVSTVLETRQLTRTQIGTPLYLAPEIWKHRPYNQKCDMWSLGILLYEMMTFSYPFVGSNTQELANRVCLGRYVLPSSRYSSDLISIVRRLLQTNPVLRPSVQDLLSMQCVKQKMHILDPFIEQDAIIMGEKLLDTIKVPMNLRNVNLPNPTYSKKADIVKPIDQRLHFKRGVPVHKKIDLVSSPELQLITDHDWWSPNRPATNMRSEKEFSVHEPPTRRSYSTKDEMISAIPQEMPRRAPRRYAPPPQIVNAASELKMNNNNNPRYRRPAIR
ncbi:AGC family protein kinase [Tritrichomonas foetus]|uniref:non-specific serine/threonine protein kinase n=1 Tax=Tritrichomonas foetus TaxID=1144522 RepID=A0A1J4KWK1_9EUKA|nr:AGC family protein kinase [Tritrichomonas foetus]|eukprot:OHT15665.1 AGC family protein kinase [Tritrichomonas foetus]